MNLIIDIEANLASFTVMVHLYVFLLYLVEIIAVPFAFAVTFPDVFPTVAIDLLLENHVNLHFCLKSQLILT